MPTQHDASRAWATWVLLSIDETTPDDLSGIPAPVRVAAQRVARDAAAEGRNLDLEIIGARYRRVDAIVDETVRHRPPAGPTWTARLDGVLTHRVVGALIFIAVMLSFWVTAFYFERYSIKLIAIVGVAQGTAISVSMDMAEGIIARFRTMGIARGAVLAGHVLGARALRARAAG